MLRESISKALLWNEKEATREKGWLRMGAVWEFFEELGERVYVSEVETNALVYMNASLRQSLGYQSNEGYCGEKCYHVLYGKKEPCPFCNNQELRTGEYITRVYKNPLLERSSLIKDCLIESDGTQYRVEIAMDWDEAEEKQTTVFTARSGEILNGCLQQVFATTSPEEALMRMLAYIGNTLLCDRVYIFELRNAQWMDNTYEWCAKGVEPQKHMLQNVSTDSVACFLPMLEEDRVAVVRSADEISSTSPAEYAFMKSLQISSFAAGPIRSDGKIIGYVGVDEPNKDMMGLLQPLLEVIGYFVASLLKRRAMIGRLREMSFHDQLTGAYNRNALVEYCEQTPMHMVGVIYCDITGLKRVNDVLGHMEGDRMILHCYQLISDKLETDLIYRIGGDEFVILYPNCPQQDFRKQVQLLQKLVRQDDYHIAIGSVWSDRQPLHLKKLIEQADSNMYENKRDFYAWQRITKEDGRNHMSQPEHLEAVEEKSEFQKFLENTYYDMEFVFQSMSQQNSSSYFYFGDMQKDMFYISDNMRDDFGFQSNVVNGLFRLWSQRISTPEFQDIFWQDISAMLREKRESHDLRYQVRDVNGNNKWVHCYGIMKWTEDRTKPLFFSGRILHQDNNFVVDPVTNFPHEYAAFGQLNDLQHKGEKTVVVGFSLNSITEINSTKGRAYADRLLKNIADKLTEMLSWKMSFHRLEGMRCMAVVNAMCMEPKEDVVQQIREIVEEGYEAMGISVRNACSFGVLEYPCEDMTPEDVVENLIALIRIAKQDADQPFMEYSVDNLKRIKKMSNMALALGEDVMHNMENFRVVVQPVVAAQTGKVIGGEVLLRWQFEGKDISPGLFIPVLEKNGMIHFAGRWVFEQAVRNCLQMLTYNPDFYLTFNISLHQLSDTELLGFMQQTLEKYHLPGSHLVAELTESCLDEQPEKLEQLVAHCSNLGMRIALDDFGSGYSSLRMLLQYPSSIIKLDRSLLQEITESDEKMHFIGSIVYACHQFGKKVCMEGVEREDQNTIIRDTGCDMIQGFYYYRPMELSALHRLLSGAEG